MGSSRFVLALPGLSVPRVVVVAVGLGAAGCNTYGDDLDRSETAIRKHRDEVALAILRGHERDDLGPAAERARYFCLRGVAESHLGREAEAHHWVVLANAVEADSPGALPPSCARDLERGAADDDEGGHLPAPKPASSRAKPKPKPRPADDEGPARSNASEPNESAP